MYFSGENTTKNIENCCIVTGKLANSVKFVHSIFLEKLKLYVNLIHLIL